MTVLVTGAAGFIGFHLVKRLLAEGLQVVGLDNINNYYDTAIKYGRLLEVGVASRDIVYGKLVQSQSHPNYRFVQLDLCDKENVMQLFEHARFDQVCNLAAQAGVRYSIENPDVYIQSNIVGFGHILEGCRHYGVKALCYASSSSVYGLNAQMPFSANHSTDHPMSLYAASKKSNELMAHTYSHLYGLPTTGLRFFTAYGPWGRPDMALFLFTKSILAGTPIDVYNHGQMQRDFTYVDDIVEGVYRVLMHPAEPTLTWDALAPESSRSSAPYRIYNIGNNSPVLLTDFIAAIEEALGLKAHMNYLPLQVGDVPQTYANIDPLIKDLGFKPTTDLRLGVKRFVEWYRSFYRV